MRLRESASSASGAWKENGRISSLLAILESPCFGGWLERASPAPAQCSGRRLTAPAAAEAARTLRRVGGDEFLDMASLLSCSDQLQHRKLAKSIIAHTSPPIVHAIGRL